MTVAHLKICIQRMQLQIKKRKTKFNRYLSYVSSLSLKGSYCFWSLKLCKGSYLYQESHISLALNVEYYTSDFLSPSLKTSPFGSSNRRIMLPKPRRV